MRNYLMCAFIVLFVTHAKSQERSYFDSLTYHQFIAKEYKQVLSSGEIALSKSVDFYFLRYRMAFSAFELKNYLKAIPHFKEMINMNPLDTIAQEYLYYAYLESGQTENAAVFTANLDDNFTKKLKVPKNGFQSIQLNFGSLINSLHKQENESFLKQQGQGAKVKLNENLTILDISSKIKLKNRFSLSLGGSFFGGNSLLKSQIDSVTYHAKYDTNFHSKNYQGNLLLSYLGKKNWLTSVGLAYFYNEVASQNFIGIHDPVSKKLIPSKSRYDVSNTIYNSYLFSLNFKKKGRVFQPNIGVSFSNIYGQNQVQANLGFDYLPLGNYNFYLNSNLYFTNNQNFALKINKNLIFQQTLGLKISKNIWTELNAFVPLTGSLQNLVLNDGFLTLNTADPIYLNLGMDLIFRFGKLSIIPSYRFQKREYSIETIVQPTPKIENVKYNNHVINLTLKWNF